MCASPNGFAGNEAGCRSAFLGYWTDKDRGETIAKDGQVEAEVATPWATHLSYPRIRMIGGYSATPVDPSTPLLLADECIMLSMQGYRTRSGSCHS